MSLGTSGPPAEEPISKGDPTRSATAAEESDDGYQRVNMVGALGPPPSRPQPAFTEQGPPKAPPTTRPPAPLPKLQARQPQSYEAVRLATTDPENTYALPLPPVPPRIISQQQTGLTRASPSNGGTVWVLSARARRDYTTREPRTRTTTTASRPPESCSCLSRDWPLVL